MSRGIPVNGFPSLFSYLLSESHVEMVTLYTENRAQAYWWGLRLSGIVLCVRAESGADSSADY